MLEDRRKRREYRVKRDRAISEAREARKDEPEVAKLIEALNDADQLYVEYSNAERKARKATIAAEGRLIAALLPDVPKELQSTRLVTAA